MPIATYILGPTTTAQVSRYAKVGEGGDLCENVTFLGMHGVYTIPGGVRVAYLSGRFDPVNQDTHPAPPFRNWYCKRDIQSLTEMSQRPGYSGMDLFLSSNFPSGVCTGTNAYPVDQQAMRSLCPGSATAAAALRPRYHFCGGTEAFYERVPYTNHQSGQAPTNPTRFLGIATTGTPKQKWLYAFNIEPISSLDTVSLVATPPGSTPSPYSRQEHVGQSSFFFAQGRTEIGQKRKREGIRNDLSGHGGGTPRPQRQAPVAQADCWFCLGSPKVEKHLVVSVGKTVYLALAKGGLTDDHVLILPIQHVHKASVGLPDDVKEEIAAYKAALSAYFKSKGKVGIIWERNVSSVHMQLQMCPIPEGSADDVQEAFKAVGAAIAPNFAWESLSDTSLDGVVEEGKPFFVAEMPDGTALLHRVGRGFPLQFGREVLAAQPLLNMPGRSDWKACKLDKDTETVHAKAFRESFKSFDFTIKKAKGGAG